MGSSFGEYIRARREQLRKENPEFSLRKVAGRVGVEPSFLSKVERGDASALSEAKTRILAKVLGEDPEVLIALSGKIPSELHSVILENPGLFSSLINDLKRGRSRAPAPEGEHEPHGDMEKAVLARAQELEEANRRLLLESEERRQAEMRARKGEECLRIILDGSQDTAMLFDTLGTCLYCSGPDGLGLDYPRLRGRTVFKIFGKQGGRLRLDQIRKVAREKNRQSFENPMDTPSGERWFLEEFSPSFSSSGEVSAVAMVGRDVTQRVLTEQALRESEERFRRLADNSRDIIFRVRASDGVYEYISPSVTRILGYEPERIYERPFFVRDRIPEEWLPTFDKLWQGILAGEPLNDCELPIRAKHGRQVWLHCHFSAIKNSRGEITALEGVARDTTARRRAEAALAQSEARFRLLARASFSGVLVHDQGLLLEANEQFYTMFGFDPAEMVGERILPMILAPESLDRVTAHIARRDEAAYEATARRKDGTTFPIRVKVRYLDRRGRTVRIDVITDITERRATEQALKESEERYRTLFEASGNAIHVYTPEPKFLDFNREAHERLGYTREELMALSPGDILPPEDAPRLPGWIDTILAQGRSVIESGHVRKDGRVIPVQVNAKRILLGGKPAILSVTQDLTLTKAQEEALKREARIQRDMAELSAAMLESEDLRQTCCLTRNKACDLTGAETGLAGYVDPAGGRFVCASHTNEVMEACLVETRDHGYQEATGLWSWCLQKGLPILTNNPAGDPRSAGLPQGHIPIRNLICAPAVRNGNVLGLIAVANGPRDFTEQDLETVSNLAAIFALDISKHLADQTLKQSLESRDLLLSELRHRVKNCFQNIHAMVELGRGRAGNPETDQELATLSRRVMALATVHNRLAHLSGSETARMDLLARDIAEALPHPQSVDVDFDTEEILMSTHQAAPIGLFLSEAVTNALKHAFANQSRGRLTITAKRMRDGSICFGVQDNGPGLAPRTKADDKGQGMMLMQGLARQAGGEMHVETGSGTGVYLRIKDSDHARPNG